MAQEIYHRSEWGNPSEQWGNVYLNADLTNELYKRASEYENSWVTDQLLNGVGIKPSIILTPTAYEDGILNSVKPKGGENLVTYSEDFSQPVWEYSGDLSIESGYTAPDGSNTAYKVTSTNSALAANLSATSTQARSIWARTVSGTGAVQLLTHNSNTNNLFTVTEEWQRFEINTTTSSTGVPYFYAVDFRGASTTLSEVILWGAQLERGSRATTYIKTNGTAYKNGDFDFTRGSSATRVNEQGLVEDVTETNLPRINYTNFDYENGEVVPYSGEGSLLLEPSRTNSLLQSNQFDTTWVLSVSIDLTSGQSGVYGSNDAWLLKKNSTGSRYIQQSLSLSSAQYSYSVYLKAESTNWAFIWAYDGAASVNAYFDLENGVVGQTGGAALDGTNIESVGNGWYRCTLIYTHAPDLIRIYPANSNGNTATGADNGIYIQHAQLEVGSYETSIINTQVSAVTRLADVCNNSGSSDLINSTEGVLYAEISALANDGTYRQISINDSSTNNRITLDFTNTDNQIRSFISLNGISQALMTGSAIATNQSKAAVSYKSNDFSLWLNGFKVDTDTIGGVPTGLNNLSFDNGGGSNDFYGNVKCVAVFKEALSDEELQKLTQV
jgi:hypothetical protein